MATYFNTWSVKSNNGNTDYYVDSNTIFYFIFTWSMCAETARSGRVPRVKGTGALHKGQTGTCQLYSNKGFIAFFMDSSLNRNYATCRKS